ncbi:MAG: hypothetical protein FWE27_03475, partial [Defluviitaleaceae bacterium]|nr:hypothetical protein [Defluviitaleaceae bacterium]
EMIHNEMIRLREKVYRDTGNSTMIRVMMINDQVLTRDSSFGGDRFNALDFWGDNTIDEALRGFLGNFEVFKNIVQGLRVPDPYRRNIL